MAKAKTIRRKCPICCPDGGAIFTVQYDLDNDSTIKRCNNCGYKLPFRQVKPTGKLTPSQQKVIDRIVRMGWTIQIERMIGRKVWISAVNRGRSIFFGDSLFGMLGVGGSFEITLQKVGGDKKLRDDIDLGVYLR